MLRLWLVWKRWFENNKQKVPLYFLLFFPSTFVTQEDTGRLILRWNAVGWTKKHRCLCIITNFWGLSSCLKRTIVDGFVLIMDSARYFLGVCVQQFVLDAFFLPQDVKSADVPWICTFIWCKNWRKSRVEYASLCSTYARAFISTFAIYGELYMS